MCSNPAPDGQPCSLFYIVQCTAQCTLYIIVLFCPFNIIFPAVYRYLLGLSTKSVKKKIGYIIPTNGLRGGRSHYKYCTHEVINTRPWWSISEKITFDFDPRFSPRKILVIKKSERFLPAWGKPDAEHLYMYTCILYIVYAMECAEFLWAAQFLHWPIPYLGLYCRPRRGPAANRLQGETAGKNRTRSSAIFNFKIQYLQRENCRNKTLII